jgi:prepilin-type N-terminal cleavage/methylation domain-containing protein
MQAGTRRREAFTLVELLVVITIISLLAAMLLPALEEALTHARRISCMNQQKQVGLAILMYAEAHDNLLPPNFVAGNRETNWIRRGNDDKAFNNLVVGGYLDGEDLCYCPGRSDHGRTFEPPPGGRSLGDYVVGWAYGQWDMLMRMGSTNLSPKRKWDYTQLMPLHVYATEYNPTRTPDGEGANILMADARIRKETFGPTDIPHDGSCNLLRVDGGVGFLEDAFGPPTAYLRPDGLGDRNGRFYHAYGRPWWRWAEMRVREE